MDFDAKTTGTSVNIREEPSTNSKVVATIRAKGTNITVHTLSDTFDWMYVEYGNHTGYISSQYVEVLMGYNECSVNITSGALNIRQTPSKSSKVLYTMKNGAGMTYLGSYNGWKCVSCSKGTGWAYGDYIFVPA